MAEKPVPSGSSGVRLPRMLGRLGLYATYVAAALLLLAIGGVLDVLVLHAPLAGWLALLIGTGPLVALLFSTAASYINYYGVWRVLRGKDEFDAGEDLKSHAADVPQAVQSLLAGRAGCVPAASTVALCCSLLLALATSLPPQTPLIGELGTWQAHLGDLAVAAARATPTATATATMIPTPSPMPTPSPTLMPTPTLTPSPTPVPVVIQFAISPTTATWDCNAQGLSPAPQTITLDNSGSNVAVSWQATAVEQLASGSVWTAISSSSDTVPAYGTQTITISPYPLNPPLVCYASASNGTSWHVNIAAAGVGTDTFTYTISYAPIQ